MVIFGLVCSTFLCAYYGVLEVQDFCFNSICDHICLLQPMEIYVDDEAKLTLHGLVQVFL